MTQTDSELDRIERSIDIDAPAARVWDLVSRPGWWVNDGTGIPDAEPVRDGDSYVVGNPHVGHSRIVVVESRATSYLAYRWFFEHDEIGTLVEFWIADRDGGVTLRVVESGFCSLRKSRDAVERHVRDNTEGWESELALALGFVTDHVA